MRPRGVLQQVEVVHDKLNPACGTDPSESLIPVAHEPQVDMDSGV